MDGFALVVGWLTIALIGVGVAMLAAFAAAEWLNGREQPGDDGLEHESGEAVERLAETPAVREWNADGWHHDPEHDAQAHFYYQDGELAGEVVEVEDGSFRPIVYGGPEYSERGMLEAARRVVVEEVRRMKAEDALVDYRLRERAGEGPVKSEGCLSGFFDEWGSPPIFAENGDAGSEDKAKEVDAAI